MNPRVTHLKTLLTALGVRVHRLDFLEVRATCHGFFSPPKLQLRTYSLDHDSEDSVLLWSSRKKVSTQEKTGNQA